jgi:hypothetical protein
MPKLHLVGITPDHRGLVLSEHARAKRGDMVLEIDDRLLEAIEKAQRLRTQDEGERLASNALPSKYINGDGDATARLTPREIQTRLRAGESIAAIAKSSGTEEAWIRRFAQPVLAEQSRVIEQARGLRFTKRGVGASAVPLGPAVAANVIDRGVPLTLPELEAAWGAFQPPEGGWRVTFKFPLRGRRQTAEWQLDVDTGDLTARNKLASELAWRESGRKLPQPKPAKPPAPAKRAAAAPKAPVAPTEPEQAAPVAPTEPEQAAQELPLSQQVDPLAPGETREVSLPKPKKPRVAATKRAAAATETPAQSVVSVEPERPTSMPPTDLDAVDVVVDLRSLDEDAGREPAPIGSPPAPSGGPPAS